MVPLSTKTGIKIWATTMILQGDSFRNVIQSTSSGSYKYGNWYNFPAWQIHQLPETVQQYQMLLKKGISIETILPKILIPE